MCNLVLSSSTTFLRLWYADNARNAFLSCIDKKTLAAMRLVCHDFKARAAPYLFEDMNVNFKARTFTKTGNVVALDRIGHFVKTFSFNMPHSRETFLPPLLDPVTGEQRSFVYTPQVRSSKSKDERQPKYGDWETTELVIQQYPPIFHAATNVTSFIRAFRSMPNLRHFKVSCPGQEESHRYRRSAVDYALISLRMAIERSSLPLLDTLSLDSVHPAALHDLQPIGGPGSTPNSSRRWSQIQTLNIEMSSFPFDVPSRTEHLRILHAYLRTLSSTLTTLTFKWLGSNGLSPLSLDSEAIMSLEACPPSPKSASSSPTRPRTPKPLRFPQLQYMRLDNAVMDASQISAFIQHHRRTLREFIFDNIALRTGDWDAALAPLRHRQQRGRDHERGSGLFVIAPSAEAMDVPCVLSPLDAAARLPPPLPPPPREPVILDTLEPQPQPLRGIAKWLPRRRNRQPRDGFTPVQVLLQQQLSPRLAQKPRETTTTTPRHLQLRDVFRTAVFPWR